MELQEDHPRLGRIAGVLLGVGALVLKSRYHGPGQAAVQSYAGNVAASFAVYFMFAAAPRLAMLGPRAPAGLALLVVTAFELTDGFGVMSNVFDPIDLVANTAGIALAWALDTVAAHLAPRTQHPARR